MKYAVILKRNNGLDEKEDKIFFKIFEIASQLENQGYELAGEKLNTPWNPCDFEVPSDCKNYVLLKVANRIEELSKVDLVVVAPNYKEDEMAVFEYKLVKEAGVAIRELQDYELSAGMLVETATKRKREMQEKYKNDNNDQSADEL